MISTTTGRWGFHLRSAVDGSVTNWRDFPKPVFPRVSSNDDSTVDQWVSRDSNSKQLYSYPGFVSPSGNSAEIGQEFYLYYIKLYPGDLFKDRYQLRRKIKLYKQTTDSYLAKVELFRYEKQSPKKTKVSIEIDKPGSGYHKISSLGYLLPYEETGFKPLYECYIPAWDDYIVVSTGADPESTGWEYCGDPGNKFVRRIGWISETQTSRADTPVYRCFDEENKDHFLSLEADCEGKRTEWLFGYLFSEAFNESPVPTSTTLPSLTPTTGPTATLIPTNTPIPDYKSYLTSWGTGSPGEDENGDGLVNGVDFGKVLN
jgi:hypothetical protein